MESNDKNVLHSNRNRRNIEGNMGVWLDSLINTADGNLKAKELIRRAVNYLKTFDNSDECTNYVMNTKTEKIFFIISGTFSKIIVPILHDIQQIQSIYVFCSKKEKYEQLMKNYKKIRGLYDDINNVYLALKNDVYMSVNDDLLISVLPSTVVVNNKQEASFMYFQLLTDILIQMDDIQKNAKKDMIDECREQYTGNKQELTVIDDFEENYSSDKAVWWYTRDCFLYRILNKALRVQDVDILFKLRFFIKDLHQQLEQLRSQNNETGTLTVYRGQAMVKEEFNKLQNHIGGFLSMNNFLSTSTDQRVSL
ncbi:unnamed protein product, partial [Didymodactylos carnosus]